MARTKSAYLAVETQESQADSNLEITQNSNSIPPSQSTPVAATSAEDDSLKYLLGGNSPMAYVDYRGVDNYPPGNPGWPLHLGVLEQKQLDRTRAEMKACKDGILYLEFGEDEDEKEEDGYMPDSDWENSASESDSDEEASQETDLTEDEKVELEVELADLEKDRQTGWPVVRWDDEEKKRVAEEEMRDKIAELDIEMILCKNVYSSNEVAALLTELYDTLVSMGHFEPEMIKHPPHTNPPVNVALAKEVGYSDGVIDLMQKLPYVTNHYHGDCLNRAWCNHQFLPDTAFTDFTDDEELRTCRYARWVTSEPLDPHILMLAHPDGRDGYNLYLDTKLGAIKAWDNMSGPHYHQNPLFRRLFHAEPTDDFFVDIYPHAHRFAPLVPAAQYLRFLIAGYRSLRRLPILAPDDNEPFRTDRYKSHSDSGRKIAEDQQMLLTLYRKYGWPSNWDREGFVNEWKEYEEAKKQMKSGGVARKATGGVAPRRPATGGVPPSRP